ncbi:MAG TPA: hypothetical protein EYN89_00735, partial [Flavobacteriales bacterium]|nr:hypothetical protein [Flavobacteriales bacterium]
MEQVINKNIDAKLKKMLFLLAFAEGASVMALEILVAKMVAPLYGASLYVWASIIGVTLSALAIGYFIGGRISEKHSRVHTLLLLLFAVSLLMALLPAVAPGIISSMTNYSIRSASLLASLILAGLPMLLLGMTPPLIISILTNAVEDSGKTAGRIYAV